ncbi:MAG: hypothetical protein KIT22_17355 [Verrucomicrobiae bacterium]|nr:hypothetical protein [Verrucomicrobiae bacterium]
MEVTQTVGDKVGEGSLDLVENTRNPATDLRNLQLKLENLEWQSHGGGPSRQLIVPVASATPEVLDEAREDLAVMSRILTRATNPEAASTKEWFNVIRVIRLAEREHDAIFLDGYGALFFLDTAFPLIAPPSDAPAPTDAKPERDTPWERTRRELAGEAPEAEEGRDALALHERIHFWGVRVEPYDADKVADLRNSLIEALQQVSNIRALKPEDWVTVVVTGPAPVVLGGAKQKKGVSEVILGDLPTTPKGSRLGAGGRSLLSFRVRKSAADDLAAGRITAEDFAKRVEITERLEPAASKAPAKARRF